VCTCMCMCVHVCMCMYVCVKGDHAATVAIIFGCARACLRVWRGEGGGGG